MVVSWASWYADTKASARKGRRCKASSEAHQRFCPLNMFPSSSHCCQDYMVLTAVINAATARPQNVVDSYDRNSLSVLGRPQQNPLRALAPGCSVLPRRLDKVNVELPCQCDLGSASERRQPARNVLPQTIPNTRQKDKTFIAGERPPYRRSPTATPGPFLSAPRPRSQKAAPHYRSDREEPVSSGCKSRAQPPSSQTRAPSQRLVCRNELHLVPRGRKRRGKRVCLKKDALKAGATDTTVFVGALPAAPTKTSRDVEALEWLLRQAVHNATSPMAALTASISSRALSR